MISTRKTKTTMFGAFITELTSKSVRNVPQRETWKETALSLYHTAAHLMTTGIEIITDTVPIGRSSSPGKGQTTTTTLDKPVPDSMVLSIPFNDHHSGKRDFFLPPPSDSCQYDSASCLFLWRCHAVCPVFDNIFAESNWLRCSFYGRQIDRDSCNPTQSSLSLWLCWDLGPRPLKALSAIGTLISSFSIQ